ncbi:hypothetical protein JOC37_002328 [Desulfohalotomaculum tongense]|uniref:hypothetical protein n=1 Tax=Desulforadius tongensis TaxID=1216062 RepID=UPI001EE551B5|nr:hypothetical protein [Desulforadius tongensis]MBM7855906.1 hypothetical protein [Desulforadius tongensis]
MDYTCLMCNHLVEITQPCPNCGGEMSNLGLLQDFYDSYSPYLDQEIYEDNYKNYNHHYCVHLMKCDNCDTELFYPYKRLTEQQLHEFYINK